MFGPGDALFGTLAEMSRLLPLLPQIGGGTHLQAVYVEDLAEAIDDGIILHRRRAALAPDTVR